jgi:hypothetical protein
MIAKRLLLMAGALVIAAVALLYCWPPNLTGDGGYALLEAEASPGGAKVAEVFAYRGGATVRGFSILLIRPKDQKVSPEDFSMRVADSEGGGRLKISWESDDRLWVQFPTSEHRLLKSQSFDVTIEETKKE